MPVLIDSGPVLGDSAAVPVRSTQLWRDWDFSLRFAILPPVLAALLGPAGAALAQSPGCNSLKAQIASLSRGDPGRAATYGRAAQRQRAELDSTSAYAGSIGCGRRKFLIFGEAPPAQCAGIEGRMQQMRANLGQLQAQAGEAGGGNRAAIGELAARYNAECRAPAPQVARAAPAQPRGLFEQLFGVAAPPRPQASIPQPEFSAPPPAPAPALRQVALEPVRSPLADDGEEDGGARRGGSRAVCVRTCDGGFFPVSYSARSRNLEALQELCTSLCPNAQVEVYTLSGGADIGEAVSKDGGDYSALPNAFKFQKSYDASCGCKPPGKTWAETLAEAEKVLGRQRSSDILVTQKKADELARPNAGPRKRGEPPPAPAEPGAVASAADPDFKEITGPDGVTRRVRIIGITR